jgi:hypothetical protein
MKSAGLSSTFRTMLKKTKKITMHEAFQKNHLAAKEKQRSLRIQAAQAQFARQKMAAAGSELAPSSNQPIDSQSL